MEANSPDSIFYNGQIVGMTEDKRINYAVSVSHGKILEVAEDETILKKRGFGTEMIDLKGRTMLPGFIDCNIHAVQTGLTSYCIDVTAKNREEFLTQLEAAANRYQEGQLIWCTGFEAEGQLINRWDLDRISSRHPIVVSKMEFHTTVVNTSAYNLLSIPPNLAGVEKDGAGMPTGVLKGKASGFARRKMNQKFVSRRLRRKDVMKTVGQAAQYGITSFNAMEGGAFFSDDDIEAVLDCQRNTPWI